MLYNWYAVTDPRGLAPKGFRVSTFDDAEQMYHNLKRLNTYQYDDQTIESHILFNSQGFQPNAAGYFSTEEGFGLIEILICLIILPILVIGYGFEKLLKFIIRKVW